ncbi:Hypothetical protein A7982_11672 [Minicystis rosea]|nr:Hypothetical protein A7982_11672 [Minicystis rosea]
MLFNALFDAIQARPRPEDVAELVLEGIGAELSTPARKLVETAARGSLKRSVHAYSSMAADFTRPVSAQRQVQTAATIFGVRPLPATLCADPARVEAYVREISVSVHKAYGDRRRMNRAERQAVGLFKCQRWYNKRYRVLVNLEEKIRRLAWNTRKYAFTRVGKSALATKLAREDLRADTGTACLVAYLSARMSMRSVFTNTAQDRAYDEVADALFKHCEASETTAWFVLAHVMPDASVLRHLDDEEKGRLLGAWWSLLVDMADMLHDLSEAGRFERATMIVARGNDSSSWNQVASGWNKAREHWISVVHALGMESMLDAVCPGKVMRLMAADVAAWHCRSGGQIHPDTRVWAALPPPWEVVRGQSICTRHDIVNACRRADVAPETWTGPRIERRPVPFRPTPELVHGVTISSPMLAEVLRKAGAFSGKEMRGLVNDVHVERDAHGFALKAVDRRA